MQVCFQAATVYDCHLESESTKIIQLLNAPGAGSSPNKLLRLLAGIVSYPNEILNNWEILRNSTVLNHRDTVPSPSSAVISWAQHAHGVNPTGNATRRGSVQAHSWRRKAEVPPDAAVKYVPPRSRQLPRPSNFPTSTVSLGSRC